MTVLQTQLTARKREQLLKLAKSLKLRSKATSLPVITPVDRDGGVPLSFAQQRLWFLAQMEGVSKAYHVPLGVRLRGKLDRVALKRALDRIVSRHEALRTTFAMVEGEPRQRIAPVEESHFHLLEQDLRQHLDAQGELDRMMVGEAEAEFDWETGPLIRGRLIQLTDEEHVLLITMHHIVSDGWSMGLLFKELSTLYAAFVRREKDPLAELAVQYADYAVWQRKWMEGEVLKEQAQYWRKNLEGAPELLELPADHPRPAHQDYAGALVELELDEKLTAGLKDLSRRHGTTLYMTLLAGWAVLLGRLSGQQDVVIGTPMANRGRVEIENLIGFFVNTLVLRVDVSGRPTVGEMLARVKRQAIAAQQHQDIPFEQVVELVQPVRSLAHSPLFQVMFAWQDAPGYGPELPGLEVLPLGERQHVSSKFDMSASLAESKQCIVGAVEYGTALFERGTVERYLGYYTRLLEGMVAGGEKQAADELAMLGEEEWRQVVYGWNQTEMEGPVTARLHEMFEEQVEKTPEAVAVEFGERALSYAELNGRANRLAHYLLKCGVGAETRVGVCLDPSVDMVEATLGVLKAGGACVPLDLEYASERLVFMMEDAGVGIVVTETRLRDFLPAQATQFVPVVCLDGDREIIAAESGENVRLEIDGSRLAYVMYPGEVGKGKGVGIEHRNVVNLIGRAQQWFGGEALKRTLVSTVLNLELAGYEYLVPLTVGATVVIVSSALELLQRDLGVTMIHTVPSVMRVLLEANKVPATVRVVNLGGEAGNRRLVERIFATTEVERVCHVNGPAETTRYATWGGTKRGEGYAGHSGRAVGNTRVYVLNEEREPVPVGVVGELYIGGAGVGRGYVNGEELTAERYVVDPYVEESGQRMYRTGEMGRWGEGGRIELMGGKESQIKIRGHRIELGEIEEGLEEHEGIGEAVVVAREEEGGGEKRLVAYYRVVEGEGAELGAEELRKYLTGKLAEYKVPAGYVRVEKLPRRKNGEVDRKALPAPEGEAYGVRGYEAPEGEIETAVAGIWREVLRVERVGRQDNFFALGGASLLAVQVIARLRQGLGVEVGVDALFAHPVLSDFARGVESARQSRLPAITRAERMGPAPLSFAQQRLWFLAQIEGVSRAYHVPLGVRLRGRLDGAALKRAMDRLIGRHEALRTTFAMVEGEPRQRIAPVEESHFHLLEHDLRLHPDVQGELERVIAEEAGAGFDLEAGPLIRGRLIQLTDDEHVLLITMHHIVSDGWSMGLLFKELSTLYAAFVRGEEDPLTELAVQYADYAVWQRKWMEGEVLKEQAEYWKKNLKDAPELLELPADRVRPAQQDHTGEVMELELDEKLTAGLKDLSRRHGTTLYMTLLAGWAVLLGRLSGQQDVVIGTPMANRGRVEIENLIGFFVNTLVLRVDVSGRPTVGEMLARVKKQAIAAQQHQDIPFEQVVELVQPVRSLAHSPLFQVTLGLQDAPQGKLELAGLEVGPLSSDPPVLAKFDLTLSFQEAGERIVGGALFATALYERATIKRYLGYFHRLLEGMTSNDAQVVDGIDLLDGAERHHLLYEWNDTQVEFSGSECIHELFQAQVERTPEAEAVVYEGEQLSYWELNRRANRLGHYLKKKGVGAEVRVGVCMERRAQILVAILGVLKAGGAYVPLDPRNPEDRLRYMVEDANCRLVVTETGGVGQKLVGGVREIVCMDGEEREAIERESGENLEGGKIGESLAYVIYTSGSTGTPKGVGIEHRQLVNYVKGVVAGVGLKAGRYALVSTLGADLGNTMIYPALVSGGSLHIINEERAMDGEKLGEYFEREGIDYLKIVPSHLKGLEVGGGGKRVMPRRKLVVGGEASPWEWVEGWEKSGVERGAGKNEREDEPGDRGFEIVNHYGPTETTVGVLTYAAQGRRKPVTGATMPLGRALGNSRMYVVDEEMEPVPRGVAGGLFIGGAGVGRGYLGRAELTADRFVPNPYAGDREERGAGERLYRTGDRVRYLEDGNLEFLGRVDDQVKIRGYRVELGEIEVRLREHAGVREVVVVARESSPGDNRLLAYFTVKVGAGEEEVGAEELRGYLAGKLPDYMVPAVYVRLESLPLTPNGKVDRKALPAPEGDAYAVGQYEAPQGEIETIVAGIWAELLKVERVGRQDNFFALGGHSLLVVQTTARLRKSLGVEIRVDALFARPVLSDFARGVESARNGGVLATMGADGTEYLPIVVRDLGAEAILDASIVPSSQTPAAKPAENVFLTGASGFLGCFLLAELLNSTQSTVYCLVRASTNEDGMARIRAKLKSYDLWDAATSARIVAVAGDLSKPLLGLSVKQFETMADIVDTVYHSAAIVHAVYSYDLIKSANVLGTQEIIRMACRGRRKVLHHISTISVFPPLLDADEVGPVTEDALFERWQNLSTGYAQSKWVAEKLVRMAGSRGVPIAIYRPSFISGSPLSGAGNPSDFLSRFIFACLQLGCAPNLDDIDIGINMLPVDYTSRGIVALSLREDVLGRCFNFVNDKPMRLSKVSEFILSWGRKSGFPMQRVSFESWLAGCNASEDLKMLQVFFPEQALPTNAVAQVESEPSIESQQRGNKYEVIDLASANRLLEEEGIHRPPITQELLETYIAYLAKSVSRIQLAATA
jgi:amino acid adenylation domain-containing protein/thioester reductase-like protein